MTNAVFEYDHILMRAEYRTPDPHRHLAVHLILGLDGAVCCEAEGARIEARGVFIAADALHTAYTERGGMLVYLFDPACRCADVINERFLKGDRLCALPEQKAQELCSAWESAPPAQADREMLRLLGLPAAQLAQMDERVREALELLRSLDEIPEDAAQRLSAAVCLSQSRLSHLFKENVGISLHRYLAWEKMRKGYIHYGRCCSITEAAMRAGFDSPSHFAATCKRMFGISFSEFVKT